MMKTAAMPPPMRPGNTCGGRQCAAGRGQGGFRSGAQGNPYPWWERGTRWERGSSSLELLKGGTTPTTSPLRSLEP
eukprot:1202834-Pyramimonas_sp.AAC.2